MKSSEIWEFIRKYETARNTVPDKIYLTAKERVDLITEKPFSSISNSSPFVKIFGIPIEIVDENDGRRISQRLSMNNYVSPKNETLLDVLDFAVQTKSIPVDSERITYAERQDYINYYLVHSLRTNVLADDGGKRVIAKAYYFTKKKPWWIPKFLWNRIPEQKEVTENSATPKWIYPSANVAHPKLGDPIRKLIF